MKARLKNINRNLEKLPWIIAHRGAMRAAPENTRAAFDKALQYPIQGLELDVQLSADHTPVVYHHRTLYQINGSRKRISDMSDAQLSRLDWGGWFSARYHKERILTLAETLDRYCEKTTLLIELKSRRPDRLSGRSRILAEQSAALIRDRVPQYRLSKLFFLSFDPELLAYTRRILPKMNYVFTLNTPADAGRKRFHPDLPDTALSGVCIAVGKLSGRFVKDMGARKLPVMTYACNTPAQVEKALKWQVRAVMTDRPRWATEYLQIGPGSA